MKEGGKKRRRAEEAWKWRVLGVGWGWGLNPRQFDNKPHLVMTLSDCVFTQSAQCVCTCVCLHVQPTYVLMCSLLFLSCTPPSSSLPLLPPFLLLPVLPLPPPSLPPSQPVR